MRDTQTVSSLRIQQSCVTIQLSLLSQVKTKLVLVLNRRRYNIMILTVLYGFHYKVQVSCSLCLTNRS